MDFIHITDTHFALTSNVRTGDLLDDLLIKLDYVINKANEWNCMILHSGDFFDKPTAPDIVKTKLLRSLRNLKHPLVTIPGNHDRLFGSDERYDRTSLSVMEEAGALKILRSPLELEDCVITTGKPVVDTPSGKPQIVLFHGFLNQEDGLNTFFCQDILTDQRCLVLLGHDHSPYPSVPYRNSIILRPGSFLRGVRNDSSDRIPTFLRIGVRKGDFILKTYPIEVAKQVELLFKRKLAVLEKSDVSYTELIYALKQSSEEQMTLSKALKLVTSDNIVEFIESKIYL